jgi:hypothetical protein
MVSKISPGHPLRRLFGGLVEQVFMTEMGICDTRLTDYLSAMLGDFVHVDAIFRLQTVDGEVIREVSRAEAEAYLGPEIDGTLRRRLINQYIGDLTLFWAGVYPESLRPRTAGVDRLGEYVLQGRRSYGIASELSGEQAEPPAALLRKLSDEFESCVHGLQLVRAGWQQLVPTLHQRGLRPTDEAGAG